MTDVDDHAILSERQLAFRNADGDPDPHFVELVSSAVEAGEDDRLAQLVENLHEADQATLLEALDPDLRPKLIELLGARFDFAALTEVDDQVREEILEELDTDTLVEGVKELESDDAVYILEDLDEDEQAEILDALPATERVALQKSLDYPDGSAGRLMQTNLVAVPPF